MKNAPPFQVPPFKLEWDGGGEEEERERELCASAISPTKHDVAFPSGMRVLMMRDRTAESLAF